MLTFPNVTPAVFALVLDQLRTEATVREIPGAFGSAHAYWQIEGNDIKANVMRWDGGMVEITILHKPWYVPESVIAGKIRDAITLAQQAVAKGQGGGTAA
jgi:hypothetical protein